MFENLEIKYSQLQPGSELKHHSWFYFNQATFDYIWIHSKFSGLSLQKEECNNGGGLFSNHLES